MHTIISKTRMTSSRVMAMLAFAIVTVIALWTLPASAQEIVATPGTYELLEGTTMQFDARSNERSGQVNSYRWSIIDGAGASLVNADQPRVTFVAPRIDEATRLFTLQLRLEYAKGQPSKATLNIRVHRKSKETVVKRRTSPWVSGAIGFGFGYLWGGWWPHPPLIVIPCPPPDTIWPPEEVPPVAVPLPEDPGFTDWVADNPDLAREYLDATDLAPQTMPMEPDEPVAVQPAVEQDVGVEPVIQPAPAIEPAPEVMPEPMPEPAFDAMPMDVPMDMPMDIPFE